MEIVQFLFIPDDSKDSFFTRVQTERVYLEK